MTFNFNKKRKEEIIDRIIVFREKELKEGKTIMAKSSKKALKIFHKREI